MAPKKGSKRAPFTEEHRKNMSEARKKQWATVDPAERSRRMTLLVQLKNNGKN